MELQLFNDSQKLISYFEPLASTMLNDSGDASNLAAKALYAYGLGIPLQAIVGIIPHITIINGKPTADSHVIQALLRWGKIEYRTIEDYRPIYFFRHRDTIFTQEDVDANPDEFKVFNSVEHLTAFGKDNIPKGIIELVRSPQPIDYRTKIEFTRISRRINGAYVTQTEYGVFTWSDAVTAGYAEKDNWRKHPRAMLYARAVAIGGRRIADDKLKGLYDKTELSDEPIASTELPIYTEAEIL